MFRRVLGLFAKQPTPSQVKTRLAAATSPDFAARVADAFLRDAVARLAPIDSERVVAFAPDDAEPFFADLVQGRFTLTPQAAGDLGHRMSVFIARQFQSGALAVVLVGADSPTLPSAFVEQAFRDLESADVVLGPATDGGYYLIGLARFVPTLFDGVAWGTSEVLGETVARVNNGGLRLALLPPWYDVDTLDDWRTLRGHVAALRLAGVDPEIPHTESLIR